MIPSTGSITFSDIQNEFGGSNPIGLNEYYRGGSYVPINAANTIPESGAINVGQFRGSFLPVTNGVLMSRLTSEDAANSTVNSTRLIRNFLSSRANISRGKETNSLFEFTNADEGLHLTSTLVRGTLNFDFSNTTFFSGNTLFTGADPLPAFDRITCATIIARSSSTQAPDITPTPLAISINGALETPMTRVHGPIISPNSSVYMYHYMSKFSTISTIECIFRKIVASQELDNLQEVFVLPGKWNFIRTDFMSSGSSSPYSYVGSIPVQNNDFLMTLTRMGLASTGYPPDIALSGVAYYNYMNRTSRYGNLSTRSLNLFVKETGTLGLTIPAITNPVNTRTSLFRLEHT